MGAFAEISAVPFLLCLGLGAGKRILDTLVRPGWAGEISDAVELSTLWMGYVWLSNFTGGWAIGSIDDGDIVNVLALGLVGLFVALFGKRAGPFCP